MSTALESRLPTFTVLSPAACITCRCTGVPSKVWGICIESHSVIHWYITVCCNMNSFVCTVCYKKYNLDVHLDQAVALSCGHTFCRECLINLRSKICPNDRTPIIGDIELLPPNYSMHEAMAQNQPAEDPFGVDGAASLLLPEEDLVIGEVLGQGSTSVVHRGTLKGKQVRSHYFSDRPLPPTSEYSLVHWIAITV